MKLRNLIVVLFFSLLCACAEDSIPFHVASTSLEKRDADFYQDRSKEDKDKLATLQWSAEYYNSDTICASSSSCLNICDKLYSLSSDKKTCKELTYPQVLRFQTLFSNILEKDIEILKEISPTDLKVFLNVGPEPFLTFIETLGPVSSKIILSWILSDWQIAEALVAEDWDFLFLEIFLNEMHALPISSLQEEIDQEKNFFELAWIKQNDTAFTWGHNYLKEKECVNEGEKQSMCILAQYCFISKKFKSNLWIEMIEYPPLKGLMEKYPDRPPMLTAFCDEFCSLDGKAFCQ